MNLSKTIVLSLSSSLFLAACTTTPNTASMPAPTDMPTVSSETTPPPSFGNPPDTASVSAKFYTLAEIATHKTPSDCWLAINDKVYDVSGFAPKHPGEEAVYQGCGKDATTLFETRPMGSKTPHSDKARSFLPNFEIGSLSE